jgi:hypothetical protein
MSLVAVPENQLYAAIGLWRRRGHGLPTILEFPFAPVSLEKSLLAIHIRRIERSGS